LSWSPIVVGSSAQVLTKDVPSCDKPRRGAWSH